MPPQPERIPDGPQAPPPELPEIASLRKMFDSACVVIGATAGTVEKMNGVGMMSGRFNREARALHTQARWLLALLSKAYGMEYMPPQLPADQSTPAAYNSMKPPHEDIGF